MRARRIGVALIVVIGATIALATFAPVYRDRRSFQSAAKIGTLRSYESYLTHFPNGRYRDRAKREITNLAAWAAAERAWTSSAFQSLLRDYPKHARAGEARLLSGLLADLERQHADNPDVRLVIYDREFPELRRRELHWEVKYVGLGGQESTRIFLCCSLATRDGRERFLTSGRLHSLEKRGAIIESTPLPEDISSSDFRTGSILVDFRRVVGYEDAVGVCHPELGDVNAGSWETLSGVVTDSRAAREFNEG